MLGHTDMSPRQLAEERTGHFDVAKCFGARTRPPVARSDTGRERRVRDVRRHGRGAGGRRRPALLRVRARRGQRLLRWTCNPADRTALSSGPARRVHSGTLPGICDTRSGSPTGGRPCLTRISACTHQPLSPAEGRAPTRVRAEDCAACLGERHLPGADGRRRCGAAIGGNHRGRVRKVDASLDRESRPAGTRSGTGARRGPCQAWPPACRVRGPSKFLRQALGRSGTPSHQLSGGTGGSAECSARHLSTVPPQKFEAHAPPTAPTPGSGAAREPRNFDPLGTDAPPERSTVDHTFVSKGSKAPRGRAVRATR
jgi:hypothetical protein